MSKRGKVLRDPHMGPGLLMVEGKQYPFRMPGVWRSDVPAKPGLLVNVDFDSQGNLHRITALPEAGFGPGQSGSRPSPDRDGALSQGGAVLSGRAAQFAASAALMLSWCWLTAVSIHLPSFGRSDLTFWQMLGYLNAGNLSPQISDIVANPDQGFFGFAAILALSGPFLAFFWRDRRASLGGFLPLGFMALTAYRIAGQLYSSIATQFIDGYPAMRVEDRHAIWGAISLGLGTYVSLSLGVYFGALSITRFVAADSGRKHKLARPQEFAA